jgi:gamma-glutamyltranspeptidase
VLNVGYSHRPVALGRHGMVASAHPAATLAGLRVLESGGTAADAAVATNAVLTVTQPNMCAVGGDLFCLYHEGATGRVHFLDGAGRSGSRASLDELARRGLTRLPRVGGASVSVPGCVRAWGTLLERFGTRALGELLAPAIRCAEGFPVTSLLSQSIRDFVVEKPSTEWHRVFTPGGRVPTHGEILVQHDLARTLRDLASEGPSLFYEGRVGRAIAAHLEADGFVTADDMARHSGEWREPLRTTYRGATVYETPPPTQGLAALLALNLIEGLPLGRRRVHSVEHLHALIEMSKLAYADRDRWIGDPAHARVPVEALLTKAYAARRRRAFDPRKAQPYVAGDPEGDTTGFVIADGHGNVVSVIESVFNAFGSGVVVPGTGVLLHNRGRHFAYDPEHPAAFGPSKQPFHTLIAAMVTRDERPLAALATMGGNGQAMFHAQILTNILDYDMDPQEAVERPRFVIGDVVGLSPLPATQPMDTVHLESRVGTRIFTGLARKGHPVTAAPPLFTRTGQAQALLFRDGTIFGGADPRGDGVALGF